MSDKSTGQLKEYNFKSDDLVWVLYRKHYWPAIVKRVYPKKMTYMFIPTDKNPHVFNTHPKNVLPFKGTDKLSANPTPAQRESFTAAMRMYSHLKTEKSDSSSDGDEKRNYKSGDVLIAKTKMGMWPVKVLEYITDKEISFQLFPLHECYDIAKIKVSDIISAFPFDQIDDLIDENKTKNLSLYNAFQDVKTYYLSNLEDKLSEPENNGEIDNDAFMNDSPIKAQKTAKKKSVNNGYAPSMKMATRKRRYANNAGEADNDVVANNIAEIDNVVGAGNVVEVNKVVENAKKKASGPQTDSNFRKVKPTNTTKKRCPQADHQDNKSSTKMAVMESSEDGSAVKANGQTSSTSATTKNVPAKRMRLGMGRVVASSTKEPNSNERAEKHVELDFPTLLLSDETAAHLAAIWSNKTKAALPAFANYVAPKSIAEMDIVFRHLETYFPSVEDLQNAVSEFNKWLKLCTKLPIMTSLTELHYIANVILPEACVYALSKMKKCSLDKAAAEFQRSSEEKKVNFVFVSEPSNISTSSNSRLANDSNRQQNGDELLAKKPSTAADALTCGAFGDLLRAVDIKAKEASNGHNQTHNSSACLIIDEGDTLDELSFEQD